MTAQKLEVRTVTVTYRPTIYGEKVVRFEGTTFGELQQRLSAARVPYVHSKSFLELYVPDEGFVCPLASESLPELKALTVCVHVDEEARGPPPAASEPVTGQPVPAQFAPAVKAVEAQPEPAQLTELDKHFARKEAKMQRKMAKVSAKLETLRFKHGIAASREMDEAEMRAARHNSHTHHHHHHPHHHNSGWGPGLAGMHDGHHGPGHHRHGHPGFGGHRGCPVPSNHVGHGDFGLAAARGDPSGANCPAEVVYKGKA